MTANLFDSEPDFGREGMSARVVGRHACSELLGATLYELEPGCRQADLHLHHAGGGVFVMTEPPYTGAPHDESRGRVCACSGATPVCRFPPTSLRRALPALAELPPTERGVRRVESKLLDLNKSPLRAFRAFRVVGGR